MKRAIKIVVTCAVAGAFLLAWTIYRGTGTRYTERITGVDIPSPRVGYQCEECDFAQVSFMRLSPEQVNELRDATRFESHESDEPPPNGNLLFGNLGVGDAIPIMSELLVHAGASEYNSWQFYLHESTGRLWIIVNYADMAGGLPPGATGGINNG